MILDGTEVFHFILSLQSVYKGVVMVVTEWQLDLQLPMQSVPITTKVVSLNPAQARWVQALQSKVAWLN
jgi:hypothetical protein